MRRHRFKVFMGCKKKIAPIIWLFPGDIPWFLLTVLRLLPLVHLNMLFLYTQALYVVIANHC